MNEHFDNLSNPPRELSGAVRRPLSGGSLVLVLFMLAALPPATMAEGLRSQMVMELLGASSDAPRRESQKELRALKGLVTTFVTAARPWISSHGVIATRVWRAALDLRPVESGFDVHHVVEPATRRAHVREALHDLPPPSQI